MSRKRFAIVRAAQAAFLEGGYAKTPMDKIAKAADVGIKTLYRHFDNKDDLFSAVMQAACNPEAFNELSGEWDQGEESSERPWFSKAPRSALPAAGVEYLKHILSKEQLALYRVVIQDAHKFPELGRRYQEQVIDHTHDEFVRYLKRWTPLEKWQVKNKLDAAATFSALLRAGIYEDALFHLRIFSDSEIESHAHTAATKMLTLLSSRRF